MRPRPIKESLSILARVIVVLLLLLVVVLTRVLIFQSPSCGSIDIKAPSIVPCIYAPPDLHLLVIVCITIVFSTSCSISFLSGITERERFVQRMYTRILMVESFHVSRSKGSFLVKRKCLHKDSIVLRNGLLHMNIDLFEGRFSTPLMKQRKCSVLVNHQRAVESV